jgi:glutathione synthase/RimK-type ligase-like ATP-grasp enzyme
MSVSLVLVGNPGCRRVAFWRAAAERLGWPTPRLVSYADLLAGRTQLADHLRAGCLLRFETAADNWETFKLLLKHGAEPARREGYPALDDAEVDALEYERGWLIRPRQAYLGYVRLLRALETQEAAHEIVPLHTAEEIADCFDKPRCQERLARASLPVPTPFGSMRRYEDVRPLVLVEGRIMVKLAHGSGAAGCVALHGWRERVRAVTTVAEDIVHGTRRLFHSKRIRHLTNEAEIAALVDRLCVEKVHVEAWLPKARWEGENFDLRVVTIGGAPRHMMVRTSRSVFTNLTLGNRRGNVNAVARRMGPEAWQRLRHTAAGVARAFPHSFTLGIDILVRPDWQRHAVLEINAFGDLLLGQLDQGEDTYTATLAAWQRHRRCAEAGTP